MSRVIESQADLEAYFSDIERECFGDEGIIAEHLSLGLEAVADEIRDAAPRQTGNLAEAIGIDEDIPAAKVPIAGLASRREYPVEEVSDGLEGVIGLGMSYSRAVVERDDFEDEAIGHAPKVVGAALEEGLDQVQARVAP